MQMLTPARIDPNVRMVNHIPVRAQTAWGPRTIPDLELVLILRGRFTYESRGSEAIDLKTGDVLCIYPDNPHTLRHVAGRGGISCVHCDLLPGASWAAGDYRLTPGPAVVTRGADEAGDLEPLFREAARVYGGYGRNRQALLTTLVRAIWLRLAEHWESSAPSTPSPRMARMLAYLRENLTRPISRRDLAEAFHLTPQHVNALFRRELGISPTQFVHRERVLRAGHYLQSEGLSVKEAAARVGFSDVFYFSRIFKRVTGMPPSRLR
jgi:AraC-like DNA-binding protein